MLRVLIEIHEGQVVRNLLENGLLEILVARGASVVLVTPAARVPWFAERYGGPSVSLEYSPPLVTLGRLERYEFELGQWLGSRGFARLRRVMWTTVGEPRVTGRAQRESALLAQIRPDVVMATHLSQVYGRYLVAAAHALGIPTVGCLMSWDNAWKGLRVRPRRVLCWAESDRQALRTLGGYRDEDLEAIGAPAFDAYLAPDAQWSREQLCARLGLDARRPYLVFATLGQFAQQIDETSPLEALLRALDAGRIEGQPQVVVRLHPWTREAYFRRLTERADVVVSRYEGYVPGLAWTPTRDEAILAGNVLRHAAVVVSPGSTMCIEPAIFDTPTVVPVFNEYMPDVFDAYFQRTWLDLHFERIYRGGWLPFARDPDALAIAVNRSMRDRAWCAEGRTRIRDEILGPLDGKATERLATALLNAAEPRPGPRGRR